ncbi:outer membrane lipoprotein carrier protein LolA [Paenibacillus filicis]|uniref:Outer membrane lipoprotein carrier protein LolA n=1 Tax=Paenibacillus gyeongsangnamensis TaxID=3388067 RepID=A0ABT4Q6V9_9BACL|nr:outer membrane lipoprotein-sorting protein [Paenibacillus filicis]MCZ8512566.1 outer membrane lipoprotein carrier protein LolA [Paenibacillus filicis]
MRRWKWTVTVMLCLTLVLAGCGIGKKNAGSVVKDLDGVIGRLQSYHGTGQMILKTGQEPQEYQVEVCFEAPAFYRIALTNQKKDITQIVLRNNDGVFVLTPHLNKSFRFQSDWPENQGQVYLYQSLVQSILMDNQRQFTTDDKGYVFDVAANYQNASLARQKVWLDKKTYAPKQVEVSDANANVMVVVKFDKFEFGTKFEKDYFDMQRNMTSWNTSHMMPTMTQGDAKAADKAGAADSGAKAGSSDKGTTGANAGTGASGKAANGSAAGTGANAGVGSGATGASGANGAVGSNGGANGAAGTNGAGAAGTNGAAGASGTVSNGAAGAANGASGAAAGTKADSAKAAGSAGSGATGTNGAAAGAANGATTGASTNGAATGAGANGAAGTNGANGTNGKTSGTNGTSAAGGTAAGSSNTTSSSAAKQQSFGMIEPRYAPTGVKKQDSSEIPLGDDKAVMIRYSGKYNYTLVESRPVTQTVSILPGDIVDLGFTLAVVTGDAKKTLTWTYDGVEFRLSTGDLPMTEMIKVAQAVQGEMGK